MRAERYFLAHILQHQFHRALCAPAGQEGPLHRCSIYGNDAAGQRLQEMLAMGASRPWPDALEAITGTREMEPPRFSTTSRRWPTGWRSRALGASAAGRGRLDHDPGRTPSSI